MGDAFGVLCQIDHHPDGARPRLPISLTRFNLTPRHENSVRIGARGPEKLALERFTREVIPLVLSGPPTATGYGEGRPQVREMIAYWPALVPREVVSTRVEVIESDSPFAVGTGPETKATSLISDSSLPNLASIRFCSAKLLRSVSSSTSARLCVAMLPDTSFPI